MNGARACAAKAAAAAGSVAGSCVWCSAQDGSTAGAAESQCMAVDEKPRCRVPRGRHCTWKDVPTAET